ncbi:aldose epimerase family protein [Alkalicoccus chagannorensis]|uniref:aldose epimerase family protein n=1 Tax=Alkalicoccus chagannorensis TaxID=427072 RepID=UPI0004029E19|nr:aldose epimerase family protein [Alkalicoccus chagannorensis]
MTKQIQVSELEEFTVKNDAGMTLTVLNFGAVVTGVYLPGVEENMVLRFDDLHTYVENPGYLGAVIGRTAGRTEGAAFELDEKTYELAANDGKNHLHGGEKGFAHSFFDIETEGSSVICRLHSPDGEDGYPGNVDVTVTYHLTADNELQIFYDAETDSVTPLNLTNHAYFCLGSTSVENMQFQLHAHSYGVLKEGSIPAYYEHLDEDPLFDFREKKKMGDAFDQTHAQVQMAGGGIDHPFVLQDGNPAAVLYNPENQVSMSVRTDQPAVVVYTANQMGGGDGVTVNGREPRPYAAVCLETQHVPNETEQILLHPDEKWRSMTAYAFHQS